jgi:hypothetical protein
MDAHERNRKKKEKKMTFVEFEPPLSAIRADILSQSD